MLQKTLTSPLTVLMPVSPTDGGDGDVCRFAGSAVAEAGHGAVVGGQGHQTRHREHVRVGHVRLPDLKDTEVLIKP